MSLPLRHLRFIHGDEIKRVFSAVAALDQSLHPQLGLTSEDEFTGVVLVGHDGKNHERVVAYALVDSMIEPDGGRRLHRLVTDPEFRQQGHARYTMRGLVHFYGELGDLYTILPRELTSAQPHVLRLLISQGFEDTQDEAYITATMNLTHIAMLRACTPRVTSDCVLL